jgi:two-component system KDP operon response regulator KdpE
VKRDIKSVPTQSIVPPETILLIEDDHQTRRILKSSLSAHGWKILEASYGEDGIAKADQERPDLVILDLGLPDMDGVEVVGDIRMLTSSPVLILSARTQESEKIRALDAGADDYLTKPFGVGELEARVRALLRRSKNALDIQPAYRSNGLHVDFSTRRVTRDGENVHLTPIEYRLLAVLVKNAGIVVTHRNLLRQVWGPGHVDDIQYLRIYMGQLRHKLEKDPTRPTHLHTEIGVGYRLFPPE